MSHVKISVIVPIFNRELYLTDCLESLAAQSVKDVEFLLIDDGSTDRSPEICQSFAAKDSRFRLIQKENGGVATARNVGLEQSSGDYIMFADSDDRVAPDFCATPLQIAEEKHADLVMFCYRRFHGDVEEPQAACLIPEGVKTRDEAAQLLFSGSWNYLWDKCFAKSLFDGIRFPSGHVYEDVATTYKLVLRAQQVYFIHNPLYWYRRTPNSIVAQHSSQSEKDRFPAYRSMYEGLRQAGLSFLAMDSRMDRIALEHAMRYPFRMKNEDDRFCRERLLNQKHAPSWRVKILLLLYRYGRVLFWAVCRILKKNWMVILQVASSMKGGDGKNVCLRQLSSEKGDGNPVRKLGRMRGKSALRSNVAQRGKGAPHPSPPNEGKAFSSVVVSHLFLKGS